MQTTKFTTNWNKKLNCDYFTTLRLRNPEKYKIGARHKIKLLERGILRDYGTAEIIDVKNIRLHQLNTFICGLDTGYSVDETKQLLHTMYKNIVDDVNKSEFNLVLYKKEKAQGAQNKLFR